VVTEDHQDEVVVAVVRHERDECLEGVLDGVAVRRLDPLGRGPDVSRRRQLLGHALVDGAVADRGLVDHPWSA
jgi:hypothetical protein